MSEPHTVLGKRRWAESCMEDISKPLGELRTIVSHFGRKASKNVSTRADLTILLTVDLEMGEQVNSEDSELLEKGMLEFLELKAANLVAHRRTETKKVPPRAQWATLWPHCATPRVKPRAKSRLWTPQTCS